jgi:hypothetical protein
MMTSLGNIQLNFDTFKNLMHEFGYYKDELSEFLKNVFCLMTGFVKDCHRGSNYVTL